MNSPNNQGLFFLSFAEQTPSIMETINLMEVIIMDVEKVIRILGYIVYTALWSPVIILTLLFGPIVWIALYMRAGLPIKAATDTFARALLNNIHHDMDFIRTGKW